jgi:N-methylhydantoinase A
MTDPRSLSDSDVSKASATPPWNIGIDVGGTFTDVVLVDGGGGIFVIKSPSRPDDPTAGAIAALERAADEIGISLAELLSECGLLVHGSTVATNTLLERTGALVGLLCTEGFRDSLEIRRGIRVDPWDHRTPYPPVLSPRYLRLPVRERIDRHGREHIPLDEESVRRAVATFAEEGVEAVAICLMNSYLEPAHELRVAEIVAEAAPGLWTSVSAEIAPIAGEYERSSTTVVDAYVAPRLVSYLSDLDTRLSEAGLARPMLLVKNNGGAATVGECTREPVTLTLSGPAAAVGALRHYGRALGETDLISLEVGGTSCDVVMMVDGEVALTDRLEIGGYDTLVPSIDIHTVGAGGGAIASVDSAGVLQVGPRGAGAVPGPACYGLGGTDATVTDAQLVLGRLRPGRYAGGGLSLDGTLAERAIGEHVAEKLGISLIDAAAGVIRVAEQRMQHALGRVSIERGIDPRGFTVVAAGGAGGMHGAAVGRALGARRVYVPRLAGVLCALGMLNSDVRHDYVRTYVRSLDEVETEEVERRFDELIEGALAALSREGFAEKNMRFERELDLRYRDQQWDVRVRLDDGGLGDRGALRARFEDAYDRLYGHRQPETRVEIVKLRLTAIGVLPGLPPEFADRTAGTPEPVETRPVYVDAATGVAEAPIYRGQDLVAGHIIDGPLVVEETTTTIFVGGGDRLEIDAGSNYLIHIAVQGGPDDA